MHRTFPLSHNMSARRIEALFLQVRLRPPCQGVLIAALP
jgi:hypothetical protein